MSFHIKAEQQKFRWTLINDLPVAQVEQWGRGLWVQCCPLCGGIENLRASVKLDLAGTTYEPVCLSKPSNKAAIAEWIKQHPEAVGQTQVWLEMRSPIKIVPVQTETLILATEKAA